MAILPIHKPKKPADPSSVGRFLVKIDVVSSAGPIRFVVKEGERVASVIETTLRCYAREGRRPILGSDVNGFVLYCADYGSDVLKPWDRVWSSGSRRFVLSRKQQQQQLPPTALETDAEAAGPAGSRREDELTRRASGGAWKSWLSSLKISTH